MSANSQLQVLILAFQNLNILDLSGPAEVFANYALDGKAAKITIAASSEIINSHEGVSIRRNRSIASLLDLQVAERESASVPIPLDEYDVLVVPGSIAHQVRVAIDSDPDVCRVISKWAEIDRTPSSFDRWKNRKPLLTICGGALFAGSLGLLGGRTCTTHFLDLHALKEVCAQAGEMANVVRKRFVDAGETKNGMRILTSGGISCGIDATLWLVGQLVGMDEAMGMARLMYYKWEFDTDGEVTEGVLV